MTLLPSTVPAANPLRHALAWSCLVGAVVLLTIQPLAAVPLAAGSLAAFRLTPYYRPAQWWGQWWPNTLGFTFVGYVGLGAVWLTICIFTAGIYIIVGALILAAVVFLKRIF